MDQPRATTDITQLNHTKSRTAEAIKSDRKKFAFTS